MNKTLPYQGRAESPQFPRPNIDTWYFHPPGPTKVPVATPAYYPFEGVIRQPWTIPPVISEWYAHPPGPTVLPKAIPWVWQFQTDINKNWFVAYDPSTLLWWVQPAGPVTRAVATPAYYPS